MSNELTPELLSAIAGLLLSALLRYGGPVAKRYEALTEAGRAAVALGLVLGAALIVFLLSCYSPWVFLACSSAGIWSLLELIFYALFANQATHLVSKPYRPYRPAAPRPYPGLLRPRGYLED